MLLLALALRIVSPLQLDLLPDLHFEPWFGSQGVEVEIARTAGSAPWVRAVSELPASCPRIERVLTDYRSYRRIFSPALKAADVLEARDEEARLHLVWPYPFPFRNRDAVVRYQARPTEGGGFVLSWASDERPGDPHAGVRIARVAGETRAQAKGEGDCRITYTYLGELGGAFPASAQEKAWREEPVQYIRAIRRALERPDRPSPGFSK